MSTKIHDNFKLGKKSVLDARLEPVSTFTNLPDPNLPSNYIPKGGVVLVEDTGKNYQAQEDPSNVPNLMWVDISVPSSGVITGVPFIELPYSTINSHRINNTLVKGAFYKITDRADAGIVVQALSNNKISFNGNGLYLLADYNNNGDYTNAPLSVTNTLGVWDVSLESSMINGDITIWNGNNYQVQNFGSLNGTNPSLNTLAYFLLPKDVTKGYILEVDFLKYDFVNDNIMERSDKRGNVITGSGVPYFQWGNDLVIANNVQNFAKYDCVNNRGIIYGNSLSGSVTVVTNNLNIGTIRTSKFSATGFTYICNSTILSQILLSNCEIYINENITVKSTSQYTNKFCGFSSLSNFEEDIDMSSSFAAGTLTIPVGLNYVGVYKLINNNNQTISKILNSPKLRFRFNVQSGNNQNFSHTAVFSAVLGNMVADSVSTNNIIGRIGLPNDFIEYELDPSGILRRYNIVKLS
jgi:hypothetical protein